MTTITGPRIASSTPVSAAAASNTPALKLLNEARSHLGWHEGANNDNPYTKHVMGDAHQPWCAAFVSTMLEHANLPGISKKMFSASAAGLAAQFQQAGRYMPSGGKPPQPGDVIFFGGRGSEHHTGLVEKVENGKVYTIEGNSGDKVSERVYNLNDRGIGGYGKVFGEGQVSSDLGLDTSRSSHGSSGNLPTSRATGRGTATHASSTGIDPVSYFHSGSASLLALIEAMLNGDQDAVQKALEAMFPAASVEDLAELSKQLKANPDLAAKVGANPELLQKLLADPSPSGVQAVLKAPRNTAPADAATQELVSGLLGSAQFKDRPKALAALMPLLRQVDAAKGNGWSAAAPQALSGRGWQP
jgi:hypothetical protein